MADIFNKVVGGISKGIVTIGANSKALVEKANLKNALDKLENERAQLLQQLGKKAFDTYDADRATFQETPEIILQNIAETLQQLDQHNTQIAEYNNELKRIDEEVQRLVAGIVPQKDEHPAKICSCGHANKVEFKFCVNCGSAL